MVVWVSEDGMAAKLRLPDGREQAWYAMELDAVWTPAKRPRRRRVERICVGHPLPVMIGAHRAQSSSGHAQTQQRGRRRKP